MGVEHLWDTEGSEGLRGVHSPVTGLCCAQLQAGIGEGQSFTR